MVSQVSAPYVRIRQHVIRLVANANGERLKIMSERELCELFGVCRSTVRKALKELVDEGELVSEDGVGMFVVEMTEQKAFLGVPLTRPKVAFFELSSCEGCPQRANSSRRWS